MTKVFVYGTLRPGGSLHRGVEEFVEDHKEDTITGYRLGIAQSGWFPVVEEGEGTVVGNVLTVSEESIKVFDRIEGAPILYNRDVVTTDSGEECYIYLGNEAKIMSEIPSGDWLDFMAWENVT